MDVMQELRPAAMVAAQQGPTVGRLRRRIPAFVVDWSLVLVAGVLAALPGGMMAGSAGAGSALYAVGSAACLLGFLAAIPGYWLGCWRWLEGRSAGHRLMGLRVLRSSGERVSAARMLGRELGLKWVAHALSFGLWLPTGALVALSDPTRRALHDRVADTLVVREARPERVVLDGIGLGSGSNGPGR